MQYFLLVVGECDRSGQTLAWWQVILGSKEHLACVNEAFSCSDAWPVPGRTRRDQAGRCSRILARVGGTITGRPDGQVVSWLPNSYREEVLSKKAVRQFLLLGAGRRCELRSEGSISISISIRGRRQSVGSGSNWVQ